MIFSVSVVLAVTVFRGPFWILELDKLSFRVLGKARRKSKADLTQSKQTKKILTVALCHLKSCDNRKLPMCYIGEFNLNAQITITSLLQGSISVKHKSRCQGRGVIYPTRCLSEPCLFPCKCRTEAGRMQLLTYLFSVPQGSFRSL